MPSSRPRAAFEPISPDFDLHKLVEETPNFEFAVRIHCDMIDHRGMTTFQRLVLLQVILGGKPLVIEGYHERLDRWTFAVQWLRDNCSSKVEVARDLTKKTDVPLSIGHYLNHMPVLTNQWNAQNYKDPKRQRMYLKDIDCPQVWADKLEDLVPLGLFYLNKSTEEISGLESTEEPNSNGPGSRRGRGVANAGDLMSSLPKEMRAENIMCYIGHEGTYTPAHREMCASLGQNIMVEASIGLVENGKLTKPGSSIWFMTETKERNIVSEYWLSRLGHDIEVESHFAQINAWKSAPFKTYVVDQRVGDFILIPPLAPHQVWNRGTRTIKVAWNRTTVETLEMALNEALPRARMVCRDEQYKNKAIIYFTLQKYSKLLKVAERAEQQKKDASDKVEQLQKDFRRLQALYTRVLISESFSPSQERKKIEMVEFDSNITCSYCRCNIFNRFLTCPNCVGELPDGEQDNYDICMDCYAMGRSCACISKLKWAEQFSWGELVQNHEQWRHQIIQFEDQITESPKSLETELELLGKKRTLAQICQLELIKRPFHDTNKVGNEKSAQFTGNDNGLEMDTRGNTKKKAKARQSKNFIRDHARCHVDCHWEPKWKQVQCSTCEKSWCYGVLFRAYDEMPQDIMADPGWECPSCRDICSCRHCRIKPNYEAYQPTGTILGHNTKIIADPRSVESLVDLSFSNLGWIQKVGDDHGQDSRRLQRRRVEADKAQAQEERLGDNYVDPKTGEDSQNVIDHLLRPAQHKGTPIDPALIPSTRVSRDSQNDEDDYDENPEEARRYGAFTTQRSRAPQDLIPDGGIIRNSEDEYKLTEAITYDYPDLDFGLSLPMQAREVEEALTSNGHPPLISSSPSEPEMVNRKRKRTKTDDGDRPYRIRRETNSREKKRHSLIVKLVISKTKLIEINMKAILARHALNSFAEAAVPVISSDLRMPNTAGTSNGGQQSRKKGRTEDLDPGQDYDSPSNSVTPEALPPDINNSGGMAVDENVTSDLEISQHGTPKAAASATSKIKPAI